MKEEIRMKPVSDMASYENQEVVNLSLIEARIKINDLENKLAFSNIRIAQCEKENDDLTAIVEKLYEKFLNKPLDNMIGKLESNLALLNEAVGNIEQSDHIDESASTNSDDSIIFDDQQFIENRSQLKVDLRFKDTGDTNCIPNDGSINLNTDSNDMVADQDSNENEANINTADLLAKVKESFKRMCKGVNRICNSIADESNGTIKSGLKCDEKVFTISDEDDSNQRDNRPASRPKIPAVIVLDDSSSQSDANDCLLVSDGSDIAKDSTIDHQKRNSFSGIFQNPSLDDDDLCILPDVIDVSNSNVATHSQTDQQENSSDSLPKSTSNESDKLSTKAGEEDSLLQSDHSNEATRRSTKPEKTSFCGVLQEPTLAELDDLSTGINANSNSITCSKISKENSFSGVLQKLNPVKFDDSSILIGAEVNLSQHDNSNNAKCSSNQKGISSNENSQNPTIDELDDSSLSQSDVESQVSHSDNSCSATSSKTHQEKSSFDVLKRNDPFELCHSSTESIPMINSPQNDGSNSVTHSRKPLLILDFLEKHALKTEIIEQETNAGKRAKLNRRASCGSVSFSPWLLSPRSTTSSLEDTRTRKIRVSIWPCPVCDECFNNSFWYSKHLNQSHMGEEGVYTCSVCRFVCATITAHKRHVNKHHGEPYLIGNR